ncbi:MAG: ATP-binding protein [Dongiaceae bacterium]
MAEQGILFGDRFLDRYAGAIISDPSVAIVELVANCWDAYATKVDIVWPDPASRTVFSIKDNGVGMTPDEFERRWSTLDYDRVQEQGTKTQPPKDLGHYPPRPAYGRNGRGRHAAFLFSNPYEVRTWRNGREVTYSVHRGLGSVPFEWHRKSETSCPDGHGTEVRATRPDAIGLTADLARRILVSRFLTDPGFTVYINDDPVTFDDVPVNALRESTVKVPDVGEARILMIDAQRPDRISRQHGIAWRVANRLVGECGWRGSDYERILDGRTREAKQFTFIVFADFLASAIKPDWSDFDPTNNDWQKSRPLVQERIRQLIGATGADRRKETKEAIYERLGHLVKQLPPVGRDRWNGFVEKVIETCPNITTEEVEQISGILANLELSSSKYGLITKLHQMQPGDLDDLHRLLEDWTVRSAKIALDEIQTRLRLIEELDRKLRDNRSDEVQDLQPLFDRSLWIFGPEFETIEFTSNKGMTEVIQKLFGLQVSGSLNRPDFAIVPDGSVGFYTHDAYDQDYEVSGVRRLVITEIKRPGIVVGTDQKAQAWKYVKELIERGLITEACSVTCFVLGSRVELAEQAERTELNGRVAIRPMAYDVFIRRAEKRMLNLRAKLSNAPFLRTHGLDVQTFITPPEPRQGDLLSGSFVARSA